jgi:hypothetical protein
MEKVASKADIFLRNAGQVSAGHVTSCGRRQTDIFVTTDIGVSNPAPVGIIQGKGSLLLKLCLKTDVFMAHCLVKHRNNFAFSPYLAGRGGTKLRI